MDTIQEGWQRFIKLCQSMSDEAMLANLFQLLLTSEEKESIATRLLIVHSLLSQEETQREMAKHLKVSISKITRGSNELKRMDPHFLENLSAKLDNLVELES